MGNLGVKMSQKCDHSMICQTAKALLQAQNTQDYKRVSFFTLQSFLCKSKNLQKQVESRWRPKNRQKRQIALSECPFRCRVALWSDTKRDTQQK